MNNVYGNCTVSFKEIEELNISDVYPMHNNLIGRWDIGNSYLDGHIRKANIDQGGKLPFSTTLINTWCGEYPEHVPYCRESPIRRYFFLD